MSTIPERAPGVRDVLGIRNFRLLWLGQVISDFGDSLTTLALLILVNRLTGSTAALATMAIVLPVPQITFGLIAGVYVDRLDRRRIMMISDCLRGIMVLGFALVSSADNIWLLYVIGFVQASIGTFFTPARSAFIPSLVPREGLLAANSLAQTSRIIVNTTGVAFAGVVIGALHVTYPLFVIDSLTFFASLLFISRISAAVQPRAVQASGRVRAVFAELSSGIKTVLTSRVLSGTMIGAAVTMLGLGAVNVLLVPLIINEMKVPETWFGPMEFAQTASMVLSGSLVALLAARFKPTRIISGALVMIGVMVGALALVTNVWHLLVIFFCIGWPMTPLQASFVTLTQTAVPGELRGRAGAALSTLSSAANVLSMAFAGVFGDLVGVRNVFVISGILVVVAGFASAWIFGGKTARLSMAEIPPSEPMEAM